MIVRDLDTKLRDAVRHFWRTRQSQSTRQADSEDRDRGGRGAATGGKQMDGFVRLVRELLIAAKVPESCIAVDKQSAPRPPQRCCGHGIQGTPRSASMGIYIVAAPDRPLRRGRSHHPA